MRILYHRLLISVRNNGQKKHSASDGVKCVLVRPNWRVNSICFKAENVPVFDTDAHKSKPLGRQLENVMIYTHWHIYVVELGYIYSYISIFPTTYIFIY